MKSCLVFALAAIAMVAVSDSVRADNQKITLGYTAIGDCVASFAAKEQGFFAKRGLDVDFQVVNNSGILATDVASGAMEAGCDVPPVLLQAIDRGVDLVAISGGSTSTPALTQEAVVIKTGAPIATGADFYGKKVGVGGIGSSGYVMFGAWLLKQHLDPKRVNFFEVPFSTQYDLLQRGTVDAVISSDPMLARITSDKTGTVSPTSRRKCRPTRRSSSTSRRKPGVRRIRPRLRPSAMPWPRVRSSSGKIRNSRSNISRSI
jgi:NitT/TauT family transport system substrate-binding protein